jgi:hypothetical protein
METKWLDNMDNNSIIRQYFIKIKDSYYKVDGYDPITNTIYEFYGDFWHGNPKIYNESEFNNVINKTFGELYKKTINRESFIKSHNYNLIFIWESEFKKNIKNDKNIRNRTNI